MDSKKLAKTALAVVIIAIPFGLTVIGGYYGIKKYREYKAKQDAKNLDKKE